MALPYFVFSLLAVNGDFKFHWSING
jgi:hypothetical protein